MAASLDGNHALGCAVTFRPVPQLLARHCLTNIEGLVTTIYPLSIGKGKFARFIRMILPKRVPLLPVRFKAIADA